MNRPLDDHDLAADRSALDLMAAHSALGRLLLDGPDVTEFLQRIAVMSAGLVPRTSCGVTMRRDSEVLTVASSDEFAMRMDEVQYGRGQGPCLQALHNGKRVEITDQVADARWAEYRIHALASGVRSSVSLPIAAGDTTVGALNVYARTPNAFAESDIRLLAAFTESVSAVVGLLSQNAKQATIEAQLREALLTHAVVDQALGIVMAQRQITSTDAFAVLREASQNSNRKLSAVATELIQAVTGHPPTPPRPFTQRD